MSDKESIIDYIIEQVSKVNYDFVVDAHCHIESDSYSEKEREEAIRRAIEKRIMMFSTPLTQRERERALMLREKYHPWINVVTGSHPLFNENIDRVINWILENSDKIIAIGEVGLDFTPPYNKPEIMKSQIDKFKRFINLAKELDKPLVIHSRAAGRQTIEVLIREGAERVLLHAFSGKAKYALKGVEAGFYFSIPPSVAFSPQKKKLAKALPLDNMMLETDSPIFSPKRGENSEPLYVLFSAAVISSIKEVDIKEVLNVTTRNAIKLFKISSPSTSTLRYIS